MLIILTQVPETTDMEMDRCDILPTQRLLRRSKKLYLHTLVIPILALIISNIASSGATAPTIDYSHNMRVLKLPKSTQVGSLIYRLKGSDADPNTQLSFGLQGLEARSLLDVQPVQGSWNEADVYLRSALDQSGASSHNLTVYVSDGNKSTQVESTILVTDDSSVKFLDLSPFVNPRHVFHVPENAGPDETIGQVSVLESQKSDLPVRFELRGKGSQQFSIKYVFGPRGQSKAELVLAQRLDYERQNLFNLKILALNAWSDVRLDTRNVATMDIVVTVGDVQDSAPTFKNLPHSIRLINTLRVGELVAKLEAEDGDYADQRPIHYALDASSPLANYFSLDKTSGELKLSRPIQELIMHSAWDSGAWSMLSVFASEQPDPTSYDHLWPPMYTRAELPLVLVDVANEPPQFVGGWQESSGSDKKPPILHGFIQELVSSADQPQVSWYLNATGDLSTTSSSIEDELAKSMGGRPSVLDLGLGSNGTFELALAGPDAHLFMLDPVLPVTKQSAFSLTLSPQANRSLFDRDSWPDIAQPRFQVDLIARDFGSAQRLSSRIRCLIDLVDINDSSPQFDTDLYIMSVYESAAQGHVVGQVRARDPDSGLSGRVRYTGLTGRDSQLFKLAEDTGLVTVAGGGEQTLDREKRGQHLFLVEARDSSGLGRANYTQLLINVLDINDNAPTFLQSHYDAVLLPDGTFHQPLIVKAIDGDEPNTANSQVAYEIIAGNQNDQFSIDSVSGLIFPTSLGAQLDDSRTRPLPSILSEPISPFTPDSLAGKILPGHEMEEATTPLSSSSSNRLQRHNGSERANWPRSTTGKDVEEELTPVVAHRNSSSSRPLEMRQLLATGKPDAEQLPALDLLLSLATDQQPESFESPNTHELSTRSLPTSQQPYLNSLKVPPVTTLIVRAHDFGIPLRSSSVKVNIYNQALMTRQVSLILNGTAEQLEQRREAIERAFSSLTGSRATIEAIDALSESSSLSVARLKLAVPQHSLVDLTDLSALMQALDYHQQVQERGHQEHTSNLSSSHHHPQIGHYSSDINSSTAMDMAINLERRLLIYIIIVAVCILALLVIWVIYSCSREDREAKLIEKSLLDRSIGHQGSYRPTMGRLRSSQNSTVDLEAQNNNTDNANSDHHKTQAKSTETSGPISGQLNKWQRQQPMRHLDAASLTVPSLPSPAGKSTAGAGQTNFRPDQHSMYNGQVWFESSGGRQRVFRGGQSSERRASSAPSASTVNSAGFLRDGSGQFFPNTLGYAQNLASLEGSRLSGSVRSEVSKPNSGRQRRRKVAPAPVQDHWLAAPSKPPRQSVAVGHTNEAFEADEARASVPKESQTRELQRQHSTNYSESSRTGSSCSSATSGGSGGRNEAADELGLTSDQELLGYDASGAPVVATRRRSGDLESLVVDAMPRPVVGAGKTSVPAPPPPPLTPVADEKAPPSRRSSTQSEEEAARRSSGDDKRGELMNELSQRLSERKSSADGAKLEQTRPTSGEEDEESLRNGSEVESSHLGDMRNGELLERQSIFAITYEGLKTGQLAS